jgi:Domain of unknown function (DUF4032)/Lipopolysaccharide kinase (Kdo/WaaP) family
VTTTFSLVTRGGHPDFLDLPWSEPLIGWDHHRIVPMAHGLSRHVVRFVGYDDRVYALKETTEELANREFRALRTMAEAELPAVEAVGVVRERHDAVGDALEAVLITRFLDFSLPYHYLFSLDPGPALRPHLVDAGALLLVRLHLDGVFWGDCSLSNVLFRRDAGALMAYLVDAETAELHPPPLGDGLRVHDVEIALENVAGGVYDLQAGGLLPAELDPLDLLTELESRYQALWSELTRADELDAGERHRIEDRIRRLNELGFDVEELAVEATAGGSRLRIRPVVVEEGHHSRELQRRTGLRVQENQARRLLNDIAAFRAWYERDSGKPMPEAVAAARWIADVYEPIVAQVPPELRQRRDAPELFHELLEHRWYLSEDQGREVTNEEALASLLTSVLPYRPDERTILAVPPPAGEAGP